MRNGQGFSERPGAAFLIALGLVAICGLVYTVALKVPREESLPKARLEHAAPKAPGSFLRTKSAPDVVRNHLLDGDFKIVVRAGDILEPCRSILDSTVVDSLGVRTSSTRIDIADPGQPFRSTDRMVEGLPFRRLVFAGLGSRHCFIYYENGGYMYPSSCLAVMEYADRKMLWVGESGKVVRSIAGLRDMLSRGLFRDDEGLAC